MTYIEQNAATFLINEQLPLSRKIRANLGLGKNESSEEAYALGILALKSVISKDLSQTIIQNSITDGFDDEAIDAIHFSDKEIRIFDFKDSKKFSSGEILKLEKSIKSFIFTRPSDYSVFNSRLERKLRELHTRKHKDKQRVIYVVRGPSQIKEREPIEVTNLRNRLKEYNCRVVYVNYRDLVRTCFEEENRAPTLELADLDFISDSISGKASFVVAQVSLKNLITFLQKSCVGEGYDLFNKNVRAFLNNKTLKIDMNHTIQTNPKSFFLLHNGITITTPKQIECYGDRIKVHLPQVVNGAQTLNSISEELTNGVISTTNLRKASVLTKIVFADNIKIKERSICESSNTQVPITSWDLRSNDDIHRTLEAFISGLDGGNKYSYIRKRGLRKKKQTRAIKLDRFVQCWCAAKMEAPAFAKDKKRLVFDTTVGKYNDIEDSLSKDKGDIPRLLSIMCFVEDEIKKTKNKNLKGELKDMDFHIIAGLFLMRKSKPYLTDFKRIVSLLRRHARMRRKMDKDITNNKIYTKSADAWDFLKGELKS